MPPIAAPPAQPRGPPTISPTATGNKMLPNHAPESTLLQNHLEFRLLKHGAHATNLQIPLRIY